MDDRFHLFNLFRQRHSKGKLIFIIVVSTIFLGFIFGYLAIWRVNEKDFLSLLKGLDLNDLAKIIIESENSNLITITHDSQNLLERFLMALKKSRIWDPHQSFSIKRMTMTIYLNDNKKYILRCKTASEVPNVVLIYYTEGPFMNAIYDNAELYDLFKELNIF